MLIREHISVPDNSEPTTTTTTTTTTTEKTVHVYHEIRG